MKKFFTIILSILILILICAGFYGAYHFFFEPKNLENQISSQTDTAQAKADFLKGAEYDGIYTKGVVVVGFNKGVSEQRAEEILKNLNVQYVRTDDVNMGMQFFAKTGPKYLVKVPVGTEQSFGDKLDKFPEFFGGGRYVDTSKMLVD